MQAVAECSCFVGREKEINNLSPLPSPQSNCIVTKFCYCYCYCNTSEISVLLSVLQYF